MNNDKKKGILFKIKKSRKEKLDFKKDKAKLLTFIIKYDRLKA